MIFICDAVFCTFMAALVHFQVNSGRRKKSLKDDEGLDDDAFGETIEVSFFLAAARIMFFRGHDSYTKCSCSL